MDARIWHQVSLELGHIDLTYEALQVRVGWTLDVKFSAADIIESFVVEAKGNIGVLEKGMGRESME